MIGRRASYKWTSAGENLAENREQFKFHRNISTHTHKCQIA